MDWRLRRRRDLAAQRLYVEYHPYCEVCLAEGRRKRLADEVHEILFRSLGGKCVEENMVSLCRPDHDRTHRKREPYLTREELFDIKKGGELDRVVRVQGQDAQSGA